MISAQQDGLLNTTLTHLHIHTTFLKKYIARKEKGR